MAESDYLRPSIPKFDGHYDHWAMLMENLLRSKEYWSLIEDGIIVAPANATAEQRKLAEESKLKDLKAKNFLFQSIERSILETILERNTARDIWESMRKKYQGSTKVKRAQLQALRKEFEILQMKDNESVSDFFSRTLAIANKMSASGETLTQTIVVEKVLRSMSEKFNYVVCSIEESNDVTTLTIDELQSSLLVHEKRMKPTLVKDEEQALQVSHGRGGGRGRGRNGSRGGRGRGRQQSRELVECYRCHKLGHYQSECPTWEEANYAEFDEHGEVLLMAQEKLKEPVKSELKDEIWFLDSGCSNHMVGKKEWLFEFDSEFRETVKLGDNSRMQVMGKGNLRLQIGGIVQVITSVYYLPELKNNLLSIGQLQQKNLTIVFSNNNCKVYHESRGLLMSTEMSANRMYMIHASVITPMCFKTTSSDRTQLWHCRYGHLNLKGLNILTKKSMVKGLPALQETAETCESCIIGKQHRDSIPKTSNWRATERLQLIHSDICGPINPTSNGGSRYFITFTDDFSRKTWTYPLIEKSSALSTFKKFKAIVEKESSCQIECLRTDRGGEFTSNEFNDFCSQHGIKRQLTAAYTPQQNGVSERKNRTILNMVRSMLTERGVPKRFWPEAVIWATYVLNRSPTMSVKEVTPEEAWSKVKPAVHYFKIFGCVAYAHVSDTQRKKLDSKSIKCIHLGVSEESKAYKLYDPANKRIIVSRDVIFDESKGWEMKDNKPAKVQTTNLDDIEALSNNDERDQMNNDESVEVGESSQQTPDVEHVSDTESSDEDLHGNPIISPRPRRPPGWMRDYVTGQEQIEDNGLHNLAVFCNDDPDTYEEAAKHEVWRKAMDQEIEAIEKNGTWELTELPEGSKRIGVKWIFKTKYNENGKVEKYKARLVAKGYSQQHGVDYREVFAPVARWDTIRCILALSASKRWKVYQLDVKSAFLHGKYTNDKYKVYKLKKALYGLKQAPRAWYNKIESYFVQESFTKCPYEHTLFIKHEREGKILIVSLYVDDLIYTGNDEEMFESFKRSMKSKFAMTDLGKMRYFLGVEIKQAEKGIFIYQQKYAQDILIRFGMENCNKVCSPIVTGCKLTKNEGGKLVNATEYRQMIGCLMYLLATRPDLAFSVCLVARYMDRPTELHLAAVKRILRYLKGTINLGILYQRNQGELKLQGWTDSDYAGDLDGRKSTSGYVFMYGNGPISWSSKKQAIVTLSTTEAEFVAAASSACQAVWLRRILDQLGQTQVGETVILCDNSSSIKLSKNPVLHGKCKHIDVRYHFLRDLTKEKIVELEHCSTQDQIADIMTKALKLESFCKLRDRLSICDVINVV
ncbi:unnamed protein product [Trifolium pratense]|uniref:Uncharacterized protein n=1 Tax=Trifolium pratense TaxID=57577 RepID=A0ACB0LII4_TRIPR|nr:unnamed protein product [Trifolium pratense]